MSFGMLYQVMSCKYVPDVNELPKWFLDAYEPYIELDRQFWVSKSEHKRYGVLKDFEKDIQKVINEIDYKFDIRLVYFSDEGSKDMPEVSHVTISKDKIVELSHELFHFCA